MGKRLLPYVYKDKLTLDSPEYLEIVQKELRERRNSKTQKRNKDSQTNLENILRLEFILNEEEEVSENFEIKKIPTKDKQILVYSKCGEGGVKNIFIYLNGMKTHYGRFAEIAHELISTGDVVYGLDRRGSGLNMRITGNYQSWINDVDEIVDIVYQENPDADINLIGFSLGARIASAYAIQNPEKINSMIFLSPGLKTKSKISLSKKLKIVAAGLLGINSNVSTSIKREDSSSLDIKEYLEFSQNDKLRICALNARDYFQAKLINDNCVLKNLNKIKTKSLVILAGNDEIVDNEKTKEVLAKFGKKSKIVEYPNYRHNTLFFGEYKNRAVIDILNFIGEN